MYDKDPYGYICNGVGTTATAARDLLDRGPIVLNWTDCEGTVLNILLDFDPTRVGHHGGPVDGGPGKLWVGVAGYGCYAFSVGRVGPLVSDYISEKLGIRSQLTSQILGDLITVIRTQLLENVWAS